MIKIDSKNSQSILVYLVVSAVLAISLQLAAEHVIYIRSLIFDQPWRLFTAHWVHVGWIHALLNITALLCLPFIFPRIHLKNIVLLSLFLPLILSLIFYVLYPELVAYAGFSGVLHGLYTWAALMSLKDVKERWFGFCILVGLAMKLVWESWFATQDNITAQWIGHPVFSEAHLWGAICALILYFMYKIKHHFNTGQLTK